MPQLKKNGFTLIELLVVVVLLGVMTSLAVLAVGTSSSDRIMEEEAKRLHALINLAREESILKSKEIAVEINNQDYLFVEYKNKKWTPLDKKPFQKRKMNEILLLNVEDESKTELFKKDKNNILRLYFLSSGEQTPFEMKISIKGKPFPYYSLKAEFNGALKLERKNNDGS